MGMHFGHVALQVRDLASSVSHATDDAGSARVAQ